MTTQASLDCAAVPDLENKLESFVDNRTCELVYFPSITCPDEPRKSSIVHTESNNKIALWINKVV